jgi:hypothetical protein
MADSPAHYTRGTIEVWDFIRDQQLNYHLGNAIKYVCRAGFKGDNTKAQDLKKAIHYLENELQHTTLQVEQSERSSNSIPFSLWDSEQFGQPDYATGFDR